MEKLSRGRLFPGLPTQDGIMYLWFGTHCGTAGKSGLGDSEPVGEREGVREIS